MEDFTIRKFHDFEDRPEWREELRCLLLTDELLRLPELVRELIEAQRRTEERLEALTARLDGLTARVDALAEAQCKTEETVRGLIRDVGELKGRSLERDYRDRSFAYFGRLVKRPHTLSPDEVSELVGRGEDLAWADAIVYKQGGWKGGIFGGGGLLESWGRGCGEGCEKGEDPHARWGYTG